MYLKSLSLVTCRVPHAPIVTAERPTLFEFNTSTLLEKALQALPSQIKLDQTFAFLLFIFRGVQLDSSLYISFLFLVLCFILCLIKAKRVYMFFIFLMWHVIAIVTQHKDLFLTFECLHSTIRICYIWPPLSYRN